MALLAVVFLMSGCAALLFETLWFRQAGLMLGNTVWSSSIVLGSFMAGLALGNAWAPRLLRRSRHALTTYALLEGLIAVTGLALVWALPHLAGWCAPWLGSLAGRPLNAVRVALAFVLLVLPATAMGATLPVLVAGLAGRSASFGRTLGWLYGWNTAGAVLGALAGEYALIEAIGVRATGLVAAGLDLLAAAIAVGLARRWAVTAPATGTVPVAASPAAAPGGARSAKWLLLAAATCGAALLALEVLWFRLLLLFTAGTSRLFAVLLAVVLAGIAAGSLAASALLSRRPAAARLLPPLALLAGASVVFGYALLQRVTEATGGLWLLLAGQAARQAAILMGGTCVLSGALFVLLGHELRQRLGDETAAASRLTLANTTGAMLGALLGGFVLLPRLGLERGLFAMAALYGLAALAMGAGQLGLTGQAVRTQRVTLVAAWGLYLAVLALFPFGLTGGPFLRRVLARYQYTPELVVAQREGLTENTLYIEERMWDVPVSHRLLTNGHSMSGTGYASRYMRLFAYWPLAVHPAPRSALLISFGVAVTAQALTHSPELTSIDVVDVSADILEQGRRIYPQGYPLDDPRVRVHIEDGRFFLLTSRRSFDVITGEPPPPKNAGIVNLYSREYFELLRARLNPGGIATYWLPVNQLTLRDSQALAGAFCAVFEDCSLWSGFGPELILVGSRGAPPAQAERLAWFAGLPAVKQALSAGGIESIEQWAGTFVADSEQLRAWTAGVPPLDDDHPQRVAPHLGAMGAREAYDFAGPDASRERRLASRWLARMWPEALLAAARERQAVDAVASQVCWGIYGYDRPGMRDLAALLGDPHSRTSALWLLGSSASIEAAAAQARSRRVQDVHLDLIEAWGHLASKRYAEAETRLRRLQPYSDVQRVAQHRVLALALDGRRDQAQALVNEAAGWVVPREWAEWQELLQMLQLTDPRRIAGAAP